MWFLRYCFLDMYAMPLWNTRRFEDRCDTHPQWSCPSRAPPATWQFVLMQIIHCIYINFHSLSAIWLIESSANPIICCVAEELMYYSAPVFQESSSTWYQTVSNCSPASSCWCYYSVCRFQLLPNIASCDTEMLRIGSLCPQTSLHAHH